MKLNESQTESFELLYASISNAIIYAKDLSKSKEISPAIRPLLIKLEWVMGSIESRVPIDKRLLVREKDTLFYDEMLRLMTHLNDQDKQELENILKTSING